MLPDVSRQAFLFIASANGQQTPRFFFANPLLNLRGGCVWVGGPLNVFPHLVGWKQSQFKEIVPATPHVQNTRSDSMQRKSTIWIPGLAMAAGLMILGSTAAQAQCMRGGGGMDPGTGGSLSIPGQRGGGVDRIGGGAGQSPTGRADGANGSANAADAVPTDDDGPRTANAIRGPTEATATAEPPAKPPGRAFPKTPSRRQRTTSNSPRTMPNPPEDSDPQNPYAAGGNSNFQGIQNPPPQLGAGGNPATGRPTARRLAAPPQLKAPQQKTPVDRAAGGFDAPPSRPFARSTVFSVSVLCVGGRNGFPQDHAFPKPVGIALSHTSARSRRCGE